MKEEDAYELHFKPLYRYFYYKRVDTSEVEDLVQETFLRFFRKYRSEDLEPMAIAKLLYTIAKNVWREWVRERMKYAPSDSLDLLEIPEVATDFQESDVEAKEADQVATQELTEALATLGDNLRIVLTLRFLEGLTRKETAAKMGISESDVHTYQKRGVKALKKALEGGFVPPSA